jgi:hypothetical protein
MPDTAAVRDRLRKLHPHADRIPEGALAHFALALPDDLDQVPYLDMTIEQAQPPLVPGGFSGSLVALTDAGLLVEVTYKDEDDVARLDMQPLRGRVTTIGLAFDPDGRIRTDALTVTLAGPGPALSLPITQRRRDPNFVRLIITALIGS